MKVFVNWEERKVVSEEAYAVMHANRSAELAEDDKVFEDFVDNNYTPYALYYDLHNFGEQVVIDEFHDHCDGLAADELAQDWEKVEVDA